MSKIVLVRGIPGSGKSTYAKELHDKGEVFINLESDNYWIRPDGRYDWNAKLIKESHQWCFNQAVWWLDRGHDIAIANTFTRLWEMQKYVDLAEENGYNLEVVRCTGQYDNIHGVSEEHVQKMLERFEDYGGETFIGDQEDSEKTMEVEEDAELGG